MTKLMDIPTQIALKKSNPDKYKELVESDRDSMWSSNQEWAYLGGDIDRNGHLTTAFMESDGMYELSGWKLSSPGNWILCIYTNRDAKVKELSNGNYEWTINYKNHKVTGIENSLNKARYLARVCLDTIDEVDKKFSN